MGSLQFFEFWCLFFSLLFQGAVSFKLSLFVRILTLRWLVLRAACAWEGQHWACSPKQPLVPIFPLCVPLCLLSDWCCNLCPAVSKNSFLSSPAHGKSLCSVWQSEGVSKFRRLFSFPSSSSFYVGSWVSALHSWWALQGLSI